MNIAEQLTALGGRFAGIDLSCRKPGSTGWPHEWRARIVATKNERAEYRLEAYGPTPEAALALLADQVAGVDGS